MARGLGEPLTHRNGLGDGRGFGRGVVFAHRVAHSSETFCVIGHKHGLEVALHLLELLERRIERNAQYLV